MKLRVMAIGIAWLLLAASPPPEAVQKELDAIRGTWTVATAEQDGRADDSMKNATVTITGDQFTTKVGATPLRHGTVAIDPTKQPKTIDLVYSDGPQKGKSSLGIYNLHEDSWILFFSVPGKKRPADFNRNVTIGQKFMVLKKEAKPAK